MIIWKVYVKGAEFVEYKVAEEHTIDFFITPGRRQSKTVSTIDECGSKVDRTVFSIAICRQ